MVLIQCDIFNREPICIPCLKTTKPRLSFPTPHLSPNANSKHCKRSLSPSPTPRSVLSPSLSLSLPPLSLSPPFWTSFICKASKDRPYLDNLKSAYEEHRHIEERQRHGMSQPRAENVEKEACFWHRPGTYTDYHPKTNEPSCRQPGNGRRCLPHLF